MMCFCNTAGSTGQEIQINNPIYLQVSVVIQNNWGLDSQDVITCIQVRCDPHLSAGSVTPCVCVWQSTLDYVLNVGPDRCSVRLARPVLYEPPEYVNATIYFSADMTLSDPIARTYSLHCSIERHLTCAERQSAFQLYYAFEAQANNATSEFVAQSTLNARAIVAHRLPQSLCRRRGSVRHGSARNRRFPVRGAKLFDVLGRHACGVRL